MKSAIASAFILFFVVMFPACSDHGLESTPVAGQQEVGRLSLLFSTPPPEIAQVVATLTRQGYTTRTLTLSIQDSTSASGSFADVAVGTWHLKVEALDNGGIVRYSGETNVEVQPGQVAHVALQLLGTSGGIQITVTWGTPPVPTSGLIAYYPFNGDANDISGNGNNGVVFGSVPTTNRNGSPNSAMFFDGIDDKITIASSPSLHPLNQLTIAFWIRTDTMHNNYLSVLQKSNPVQPLSHREYAVHLKQGSPVLFYCQVHSAGDGGEQHTVFSNNFSTHQWLFFTAVIDRQNHVMKTYMNGILNQQINDSYSSFNANNDPLMIGVESETWPDHSPFRGALDEIRLYNRALTGPEIVALYNMQ